MSPGRTASRLALLWRAWRYRIRLDPAEIAFLLRYLGRGACAVDVGAHKGGYTYWMQRAVGPDGRVFAFEPQPGVASALRSTLAAARIDNVTVENVAVSDRPGQMTLTIPEGSSSCGATLEARASARDTYSVEAVTLDGYFAARPDLRPALVKVDVEGHEASVFRGAARLLDQYRPALLFECEARHHQRSEEVGDVFSSLERSGYEGWFFLRGTRAPLSAFRPEYQATTDQRSYVNNFLFLPR